MLFTDLVEDASLHLVALALIGPVLTSEVPAAVLGLSELKTIQTETLRFLYNSDISFSEGFENNFKFLGSKYLEGGMKLVCHEARKGKSVKHNSKLNAVASGRSPLAVPAQALVVHGQLDRGGSRSGPPQPVD